MKEKLKALKDKLDPKVALIGGVVVVSTSFGTCHFMEDQTEQPVAQESAPEKPNEPAKEPQTEPEKPEAEEESV